MHPVHRLMKAVMHQLGIFDMRAARHWLASAAGLAALLAAIGGGGAQAQTAELRIRQDSELSFGTFMVFGNGARSVSPSGNVTDQAVVALDGTRPRPARFTIIYDRGEPGAEAIDVTLEVVISAPDRVRQRELDARISALETDIAGYQSVASGEAIMFQIDNCRTRLCSRSFNLGARLDVTRHHGGAAITIPIDLDARMVSAEQS